MVLREQDSDARDDAQLQDELSTICHLRHYATGFSVELGSSVDYGSPEGACSFPSSEGCRDGYTCQGRSVEVSEEISPVPLSWDRAG